MVKFLTCWHQRLANIKIAWLSSHGLSYSWRVYGNLTSYYRMMLLSTLATVSFIDPAFVLLLVLSFMFVIVCSLFDWKDNLYRFCIVFIYKYKSPIAIYIYILQLEIHLSRGVGWGPINKFYPPHLHARPKTGPGMPASYAVVNLVFSEFS